MARPLLVDTQRGRFTLGGPIYENPAVGLDYAIAAGRGSLPAVGAGRRRSDCAPRRSQRHRQGRPAWPGPWPKPPPRAGKIRVRPVLGTDLSESSNKAVATPYFEVHRETTEWQGDRCPRAGEQGSPIPSQQKHPWLVGWRQTNRPSPCAASRGPGRPTPRSRRHQRCAGPRPSRPTFPPPR